MRYAIVKDGLVVNLILWDGQTKIVVDGEVVLAEDFVGPGWRLGADGWAEPEQNIEDASHIESIDSARDSAIQKLLKLGLTKEEAIAILR